MAGILLAAGDGSRIGQPKALVVIGGQSLARRGIGLLEAGGARPVIVVSGAASLDAELREPVWPAADHGTGESDRERPAVISVHNPRWQAGMGSSLAAGLAAVPGECTAAVLALADQPLVGPEAVRRLIAAHAAGASVAVACYDGKPRNPVLIGQEHWAEVAALAEGDVGARPFLRAHPEFVTHLECADTGRPDDIDTVEDLARVTALLGATTPFRS
ncbi:MAG TPA: nucleotidyltransferase family protein [Streptosporangiaceae bacterium]|nr:nucleotidyltransferase family protein [Streptosporangiaceae bacterium]